MTNSGNKYKFATIMKNRSTKKTVILQKKLKSGKFGKPCEYEMFGGETTAEDVIKRLEKSNPDSTWRIAEAAEETVAEAAEEIKEVIKMKTFVITVNHGAAGLDETKREFFVTAEDRKAAKKAAVEYLLDCGNDGYEYIVEIEETEEETTEETVEEVAEEASVKKSAKKTRVYKALVRDSKTREFKIIESEYANKTDFYKDLKTNGYRVRVIATPDKFEEACNTWSENADNEARARKYASKARRESEEKLAAAQGMTIKEYHKFLKENGLR